MRRVVGSLLLSMGLMLLVAGGLLVATETGLRLVWGGIVDLTDGQLSAHRVEGRLIGEVRIEGLRVPGEAAEITLERARLSLRLLPLLAGRVSFAHLDGRELRVRLQPPTNEPEPAAEPPRLTLPITLVISQGRIAPLVIERPDAEPLQIEQIDLRGGRLSVGGLRIDELRVTEADNHVALQFDAGPALSDPLRGRLQWQLAISPDAVPVAGSGPVSGTLIRPRLQQTLAGPLQGTVEASAAWLDEPLRWTVEGDFTRASLRELLADGRDLELSGRLSGQGDAENADVSWQGPAADAQLGSWQVAAALERRDQRWHQARLELDAVESPGHLDAQLRWRDEATLSGPLDALVNWDALRLAPDWTSDSGKLVLEGSLEQYQARGAWRLGPSAPGEMPGSDWRVRASGGRDQLRLSELTVRGLGGTLSGEGQLDWRENPRGRLQLRADGLDPGRLVPGWDGQVRASLAIASQVREGGIRVAADLGDLGGQLRGYPLAGSGSAVWDDGDLRLKYLRLQSGSARLEANGVVAETWAMQWQVIAPDLAAAFPAASGSLRAEGALSGTRAAPRLVARAKGSDIGWAERQIGLLELDTDVDLSGAQRWRISAHAQRLRVPELAGFEALMVDGQGTAADHAVRLHGRGPERDFQLVAEGGLDGERWTGRIRDGQLTLPRHGQWLQTQPSDLTLSRDSLRLERWCWASPPASGCLVASLKDETWAAEASLQQLPLEVVNALALDNPRLEGRVSGDLVFQYRQGVQRLQGTLESRDGNLGFALPEDEPLTLPYQQLRLAVNHQGEGASAQGMLRLEDGGLLEVSVRLPKWRAHEPFAGQPLRGQVTVALRQLDWIAALTPEARVPQGHLQGRVALGGTVAAPAVAGELRLEDGGVILPALGIELRDLRLGLDSGGDGTVGIEASATSGGGELTATGRLQTGKPWRGQLAVQGRGFEAVRLPPAQLWVNPDLELTLRPGRIDVAGEVFVPKGELRLPEFQSVVEPSPDVILVDQPAPSRAARWQVVTDVVLRVGEQVTVTGFGFDGRLQGRLRITEQALEVATARGELAVVDGRYEAYGQRLTIVRGRLLYANNPLNNPGIDVQAVREVDEVSVGVLVSGRLQNPEMRLFSQPNMEESEILSYLVLGRPLATASSEEADVLQRAALSLSLAGGERVARQIATQFGIDVVDVQGTGRENETALVLGKHLSPRLYVQYAVGIWEAINTFRVRYRLGRHWVLEAESGPRSGADLLYSIER